jgi:hypothetical protein
MTVRLLIQRLLQLDDCLLIFACICLTGATAVVQWGIPAIHQVAQLALDPANAVPTTDLNRLMVRFVSTVFAHSTLSWGTIFAAKFSYLFFFRQLIDRIRNLVIYWRVVVTFTAMAAILSMLLIPVTCPHVDIKACELLSSLADSTLTNATVECGHGFRFFRALKVSIVIVTLDIATDLMSRD